MTAAQLAADELLPFSDFPTETAVIGGRSYSVLVGSYRRANKLEEGGLFGDYDLTIMVERAAFAAHAVAMPVTGDPIIFREEYFRVESCKQDDAQSYLTINSTYTGARQPVAPLQSEDGQWTLTERGDPIDTQ